MIENSSYDFITDGIMKLKIYISVVLFLAVSVSYSQDNLHIIKYYNSTDSIDVDPYSFLPMQVGNFWQYAFLNEIVREERVTKDSLLEHNSKLYWINNFPSWTIDTNCQVFQYSPPDAEWSALYFKLDADLGDEWTMWQSPYDSTESEIRRIEQIFQAEYLGINTVFKEVVQYTKFLDDGEYYEWLRFVYLLGAGLGIVQIRNDEMPRPPEYLLSAIIDGDTLGTIVGVENDSDDYLPSSTKLFQNYPNPFNPVTKIKYQLSKASYVTIKLYDMLGREVKELINDTQEAGYYELNFDGSGLSSGTYIYRITAGDFVDSKKLILLK